MTTSDTVESYQPVRLGRRLACMVYDAILLIGLFFLASFPLVVTLGSEIESNNEFYLLYLVLISQLYFCWCWSRGGQTLGMKTWKVSLYSLKGTPPATSQLLLRFLFALLGLLLAGIGLWWALFDRDKMTLYDRWSGTGLRQNTN